MEETGSGQKKCEGRKQEVNGRNRQQEEHVHSQYATWDGLWNQKHARCKQ
jgi:hypothetical protein